MRKLSLLTLFFCSIAFAIMLPTRGSCQTARSICAKETHRVLGSSAIPIAYGSFLNPDGPFFCVGVVPIMPRLAPTHTRARKGVVLERVRGNWRRVLWFDNQIRNENGYIGIDFVDRTARFGFDVTFDDHRGDGTEGFTMYFTYLNSAFKPEGVPIEISWNPKVERFQEYAANELNPPDFKPELPNPPIR